MATQKTRVLNYLRSGNNLTAYHAEHRMDIGNVREIIRQLREEGHLIYTNRTTAGTASYRMGTPTREMIATLYKFHGAQLFN